MIKKALIFAAGKGTRLKPFTDSHPKALALVNDVPLLERNIKYLQNFGVTEFVINVHHFGEQIIEFLKAENIDIIVLAGFLLKIPEAFVKAFPNKIINIHPSLLPKYGGKGMYGMNVHKAVVENKETESGITIHYVNEEYDKGEIILQAKCEVNESDTPETLSAKIRALEFEYFPKAIEKII